MSIATAPDGGLHGGTFNFPVVSVGATENAAHGGCASPAARPASSNAAREPGDRRPLPTCCVAMGADIEGIGTDTLAVTRQAALHGATYTVMPDRIEAGSYACAAAITGGELDSGGANAIRHARAILSALREAGVHGRGDTSAASTIASTGQL